ncbi:MAG TPA: DUF3304 domain-containing protein [Pseudomonas sp.]
MNSIRTLFRWLTLACALSIVLALSGCEPPAPRKVQDMAVGITGYNFTAEGVQEYYVNGSRGSNLPSYGGGGKTSCCVRLPGEWTPEVTVKVDWTIGHWTTAYETRKHLSIPEQIQCCFTERTLSKTVPVERYGEEGGRVQVFFLPNDEIKVWVSNLGLGHARHPSGVPYPRNPANPE